MSEANGKVCCNCRHDIRHKEDGQIINRCDIDEHYIRYIACFTHWCKHWAKSHKFDNDDMGEEE